MVVADTVAAIAEKLSVKTSRPLFFKAGQLCHWLPGSLQSCNEPGAA
jgi:hypothetical protein